jgi:hypothetical protein
MEAPISESVLSALGELRGSLHGELQRLLEKKSGLEGELQAVGQEIESKQRALELVKATERQLAGQGRAQPDVGGEELVSTVVRALSFFLTDWPLTRYPGCSHSMHIAYQCLALAAGRWRARVADMRLTAVL